MSKLSNSRRSCGFSMVEVLVALVVLCVGMLGVASLYIVTLRSSGSAITRMQAVNLASDIGDRIRANRKAKEAYTFNSTATLTDAACVGTSATCTAADMAKHDLFVWKQQIAAALPANAVGTVTLDAATNPITYLIKITWIEPGQSGTLEYQMRVQI